MEINLRGPYLCARAVLPGMLSRGVGRIVNVGSNIGIRPSPNITAYASSKAALLRFTDSLAEEVKGHGLQVFAISPGWVWTAMTRHAVQEMEAAMPDFEGIPESVIFPPEDCANLILRLAAGQADQLTGRYIHVADDLDQLIAQAAEIQTQDLYTLRLRT